MVHFVVLIKSVAKMESVNLNLDYVFAKILKDVFMVPNAKAIRIVAKEASAILKLNCALDAGKDLNNRALEERPRAKLYVFGCIMKYIEITSVSKKR